MALLQATESGEARKHAYHKLSSPQLFLLSMVVFLAIVAFIAIILTRQIQTAFATNPGLNGLILGVLVVGTLSYVDRAAFPDKTVWSHFGSGYGYVPLVLPVIGLLWLRHVSRDAEPAPS